MSEENVDVVRRLFAATFESGIDAQGLDRAMEFWDEEIDWRAIDGAPDDVGVFGGGAALRHYYEEWAETFADLRATPEELIDAGERVIAVVRATGRMHGSDAEVGMQLTIVYELAGGKVIRGREYAARDEALRAAGLGGE